MMAANSGRVANFRKVSYIVFDKADQMFDLGFEPQVMRIIENVQYYIDTYIDNVIVFIVSIGFLAGTGLKFKQLKRVKFSQD